MNRTPSFASMDACFAAFDKDCDGNLNVLEFETLCRALFRNEAGESYPLDSAMLRQMFDTFDKNGDGTVDRTEFSYCWNNWIKTIVRPVSALLVIDVQNDFLRGTLDIRNCAARHDGVEVIEPINRVVTQIPFEAVYYSYDWHPSDHVSFIDNIALRKLHISSPITNDDAKVYDTVIFDMEPPMQQKLWPRHCVQNTWGAELYKDLKVCDKSTKIYKGTNPDVDSYSLFWDNMKLTDTKLDALLKAQHVTDVYLCGVAYDVCVGSTAKDALTCGYRTILLDDCCRGVDEQDIEALKDYVRAENGVIVHSDRVKAMVEGMDRRPELGLKLAFELRKRAKM